jgi:carbonic anhydrase
MTFCTVINCIDGRVQLPVIDYLRDRFDVEYVDVVSEAGPVRILSSQPGSETAGSIFRRVEISIEKHRTKGIAIVAHYDCAGNSVPESDQREQLRSCLHVLSRRYSKLDVIGLWVDAEWGVSEFDLETGAGDRENEDA